MIIGRTKHDPELSSIIWPMFTATLDEKHGVAGTIGRQGEEAALKILQERFPTVKYAIMHDDCLNQMMGIDITLIHKDNSFDLVDVKSGRSGLYYADNNWYITLRKDHYNPRKKTEYLMHIGPKGDVFAFYNRALMAGFIEQKRIQLDEPYKLKRRHFPDFVTTNVN